MRFGRWIVDENKLSLDHDKGYKIDLEATTCSAQMLDWIFQINAKAWATIDDLGQLIKALDAIFYPQSTLCSFGVDHNLDATKFLMERFRAKFQK